MKPFFALVLFLSVAVHAAPPPIPVPVENLTQEKAGMKLIHEILFGDTESVSRYFVDSVKPSLTRETLHSIQSQINWLSKMIGDSMEVLMTGTQTAPNGETAFFREYRLAAESNKRSPLIVVHIWFKDSLVTQADGAFVKTFLENSEKRIEGEQTWKVDGRDVDINEVAVINLEKGSLLAIKVYDDDTTAMDTTLAKAKGVPIIKEAIARGFLAKAKMEAKDKVLMKDIGIAFILKDPHFGFTQYKYGIAPKYFGGETDSVKTPKAQRAKKNRKTP